VQTRAAFSVAKQNSLGVRGYLFAGVVLFKVSRELANLIDVNRFIVFALRFSKAAPLGCCKNRVELGVPLPEGLRYEAK
jgi:hypothetical protein